MLRRDQLGIDFKKIFPPTEIAGGFLSNPKGSYGGFNYEKLPFLNFSSYRFEIWHGYYFRHIEVHKERVLRNSTPKGSWGGGVNYEKFPFLNYSSYRLEIW